MEISLKWILLNFSYFIFFDFLPRNFISGDEMLLSISDWLRNLLIENRNVPIKKSYFQAVISLKRGPFKII